MQLKRLKIDPKTLKHSLHVALVTATHWDTHEVEFGSETH
jgi:hypothetical protein